MWLCKNCLKIVNTQHGQHECGISFCKQCSKRHAFNDAYFMQPVGGGKNLKAEKKFLYIFYDFETRQDTPYGENGWIHVPNLCVAHQVCTDCIDVGDLKIICSMARDHFHRGSGKTALEFMHSGKHGIFGNCMHRAQGEGF